MARESVSGAALITRVEKVPLRWFREVYPHLDHAQGYRPWYAVRRARVTSFGPLSLPLVSAGSVAEVVELLTFLPLISSALGTQSIILCLRPGRRSQRGVQSFLTRSRVQRGFGICLQRTRRARTARGSPANWQCRPAPSSATSRPRGSPSGGLRQAFSKDGRPCTSGSKTFESRRPRTLRERSGSSTGGIFRGRDSALVARGLRLVSGDDRGLTFANAEALTESFFR